MDVFKDITKKTNDGIKFVNDDYLIQLSDVIITAIEKNKNILLIGIDECGFDAEHIASELNKIDKPDHPPIKTVALKATRDDDFVSRFVGTWGGKGDVLITFSTGNDMYLNISVETAKLSGMSVISFTGSNTDLMTISDYPVEILSEEPKIIENGYMISAHFLCELVERGMYNSDRKSKYRR